MTADENLTNNRLRSTDEPKVTERIRKFLWQYPHASPKEVCRILFGDDRQLYLKYRNMVSVEKSNLKKYLGTKVQGRLPKPLVSAHRVEWCLEKSLDMPTLLVLGETAGRQRPQLSDPRPVDVWYVVPNRNNMREFHNEFISVRVFPKSGTVRILPGQDMDFATLQRHVKIALLKGGLPEDVADLKARLLIPGEKHRTFRIGPVTPFKIDFYKESLGLEIGADGSHPEHIETRESWPSWPKPLIESTSRQILANEKQTEAITLLTEQIKLHLSVMQGIDAATRLNADASQRLAKVVNKLYRVMRLEKARKKEAVKKGQKKLTDW